MADMMMSERPSNGGSLGGGASAVEMSAELVEAFPDKKVTLVSRSEIAKGLNHESRLRVASYFQQIT